MSKIFKLNIRFSLLEILKFMVYSYDIKSLDLILLRSRREIYPPFKRNRGPIQLYNLLNF